MLETVANISQLIDLGLNLKQVSNDDLMRILLHQNEYYLEEILSLLRDSRTEVNEMHKKYIKETIEKGDKKSMEHLEHILYESMEHIRECDVEMYNDIEHKLYIGLYGRVLTEDRAKHIITGMSPYGMKWRIEETRQLQTQHNLSQLRDVDFWAVMNMAYNDYHSMFDENIDMYVNFTKCFLLDEDAKEDKVFTYFTQIPER